MAIIQRIRAVASVAVAAIAISLSTTAAFGEDDKLRDEANELFGAIEMASDAELFCRGLRRGAPSR